MIYKIIIGIVLTISSFVTLAHPGHGVHIELITSIGLQHIFDISAFILLLLSVAALKVIRLE